MTRTDKEVCDSTSAKETRSMLIMDDNTVGISSVNSTVPANRANIALAKKNPKMKIDNEKRGAGRHLFSRYYS